MELLINSCKSKISREEQINRTHANGESQLGTPATSAAAAALAGRLRRHLLNSTKRRRDATRSIGNSKSRVPRGRGSLDKRSLLVVVPRRCRSNLTSGEGDRRE